MNKDSIEYLIAELQKWSHEYEFQFQFWGDANNNVFIEKGGIEVASFGGEDTIKDILKRTVDWIHRTNPGKEKPVEKVHRCMGCGSAIAKGNDYCGECLCEDDGY